MKRPPKEEDARRGEAALIGGQLDGLGFPEEALADVRAALEEFVSRGYGVTKTFRFRELGVAVTLMLSTQPHVTSYARVSRQ